MLSICPSFNAAPLTVHKVLTILFRFASLNSVEAFNEAAPEFPSFRKNISYKQYNINNNSNLDYTQVF